MALAATNLPAAFSRRGLLAFGALVLLILCYHRTWYPRSRGVQIPIIANHRPHNQSTSISEPSKVLVVASVKQDDTSWLRELLPDWRVRRYVTDDPGAQYTVPNNKGREAMVYLTYIIDNYQTLLDLSVFIHAARYQWHNDDPLYDGYYILRNLQIPYLVKNGYTNLRCVWAVGCPPGMNNLTDITLTAEQLADDKTATDTGLHFVAAFRQLFPGKPLPYSVGSTCCAQFAVSRETIQTRPIEDYIHFRKWLSETKLVDHVSGRIFEYTWHMIFGRDPVHCPNARECYCKVFGYCELECGENQESSCGERWPFPKFANIPEGWPSNAWDDKKRTKEEIENARWVAYKNSSGLSRSAKASSG